MTGVKCKRQLLGDYDRSGRRRPVAGTDPEFVVAADQVIAAIGQSLDAKAAVGDLEVGLNKWGYFDVDAKTGQTSIEWVFSGGDAATGPASVVEAIGAGERAATGIDEYLTGANHAFWRRDVELDTYFDPDAEPVLVARAVQAELPVGERVAGFAEVELGLAADAARREAQRCLRCDYGKPCSMARS